MQEPPASSEREQRAFEVLQQFCEELEAGRAPDPSAVVARHPECAVELRRLLAGLEIARDSLELERLRADLRAELAELQDPARYERLGVVGTGGMGTVYRVLDRRCGRVVAMKLIRDQAEAEPGSAPLVPKILLRRFLREARVTSHLAHPGIVPVYDIGVDEQWRPFYTMKLVEGIELQRLFRAYAEARAATRRGRPVSFEIEGHGHRLGLHDLIGILLRVCDAIGFAHRVGVIHRDLKPGNVLVGEHGQVYVMDWGLARLTGEAAAPRAEASEPTAGGDAPDLSMEGSAIGTAYYMPPEQARGALQEIGPRSDVYALGAMLYELLEGHAPYADPRQPKRTSAEVIARVREGPPPPPVGAGAPPELVTICRRAIAYRPEDRFQSVEELADQLRRFAEGRVVSVYATGPWQEVRKWMRRNPALASAVGASLAALVLGVIGTSWGFTEARARASEFDQLAGVVQYQRAVAGEQTLYPAWPPAIAPMERWLDDCDRLLAMRPVIERTVAELRARAVPPAGGETSELAVDDEASRFLHDTLAGLLQRLGDLERNEVAQVGRRLRWARQIDQLTRAHPLARASWVEARAAIAQADGAVASELYAGRSIPLRDEDVLGLVPIGMNPVTKLWEFYHLRSAWDGESDPAAIPIPSHEPDGSIRAGSSTGIVFALLPGGTFAMGAQSADDAAPSYDALARENEVLHTVTLAPFFLARHELTRGQWVRLAGPATFWWNEGTAYDGDPPIGAAHPAESISWDQADRWLARHGLLLPTEAQWEYGCRAGTTTPWWSGTEPHSLATAANIGDLTFAQHNPDADQAAAFADGFTGITAVGTFRANPFGLFDVHGNVWEWCRDWYGEYREAAREGDGLRKGDPSSDVRICRGGSYGDIEAFVRSATRIKLSPTTVDGHVGLRPARALQPRPATY